MQMAIHCLKRGLGYHITMHKITKQRASESCHGSQISFLNLSTQSLRRERLSYQGFCCSDGHVRGWTPDNCCATRRGSSKTRARCHDEDDEANVDKN
eukprot:2920094-Rhodomonas_salina.6